MTLRPSFKQSISAVPLLSVLHFIKSSLYFPHRAPIKKLALSNGAELAPTSCTAGIEPGSGVVSMSVDWENLRQLSAVGSGGGQLRRQLAAAGARHGGGGGNTHLAWRPDMVTVVERDGCGMGMSGCGVFARRGLRSWKLRCRICTSGRKRAHGPGVE